MVSSKAVPEDLNLKLRSKFNNGFTNHGCLHCAILKAFKKERAHGRFFESIFFSKCSKLDFWDLENFKTNMKFTRAARWSNSKISNRNKIFLCCHYYWSLLKCNYWSSLMMWYSTSWSRLNYCIVLYCIVCIFFWFSESLALQIVV